MNLDNLKAHFFSEVEGLILEPQSGRLGYTGVDGSGIFYDTNSRNVVVNPLFDLCIPMPGFAFRRPLSEIKQGDIVLLGANNEIRFVQDVVDPTIVTISADGKLEETLPPEVTFFGQSKTVLVVSNFMSNQFGAGMDTILPLLLAGSQNRKSSKGGDPDISTLLMMQVMSGQNGGMASMNPMMLALLMKKGDGDSTSPFALAMLMSGMAKPVAS